MGWVQVGGLQFLIAFLLVDFCRYWLHLAHHKVPWLWTFHRVHHSSERLDSTSGLRMHFVDFVQLSLLPMVMFALVLDVASWDAWALPAALAVGVVSDAFQHGNIRVDMGHPLMRAWDKLFNHPHFHAWHHTRDGQRCDGNYGNALVVWDRLFGTEVTGPQPPELFGLVGDQALDNGVVGLQLLRRRRRGA